MWYSGGARVVECHSDWYQTSKLIGCVDLRFQLSDHITGWIWICPVAFKSHAVNTHYAILVATVPWHTVWSLWHGSKFFRCIIVAFFMVGQELWKLSSAKFSRLLGVANGAGLDLQKTDCAKCSKMQVCKDCVPWKPGSMSYIVCIHIWKVRLKMNCMYKNIL